MSALDTGDQTRATDFAAAWVLLPENGAGVKWNFNAILPKSPASAIMDQPFFKPMEGIMASPKETLVKLASDYYMWIQHQGPVRQDNLFRTYLWLATLVLGVSGTLFDHADPSTSSALSILLLISSAVASFSVLYCLFHMRGRGDVAHPNLEQYCKLLNGEDDETRLSWMIEQYWEATRPGKVENMRRTRSLRLTTWLVSISFVFLVAAGALYAVTANHPPKNSQGGDIHMSEEKPATAEREQSQPAPEPPSRPPLDHENALNRDEGPKPETGQRTTIP